MKQESQSDCSPEVDELQGVGSVSMGVCVCEFFVGGGVPIMVVCLLPVIIIFCLSFALFPPQIYVALLGLHSFRFCWDQEPGS